MKKKNPIREVDAELLKAMLELRDRDPDALMDLVLASLKLNMQYALEDESPVENKVKALQSMLAHYEGKEEYENCAFVFELKRMIEDAKGI